MVEESGYAQKTVSGDAWGDSGVEELGCNGRGMINGLLKEKGIIFKF